MHYELGVTLGLLGRDDAALRSSRRAVRLKADIAEAWRLIADHLIEPGDPAGADAAWANHRVVGRLRPRLLAPATALFDNRLPDAEAMLRAHMARNPDDPDALRMLAEVARARVGRCARRGGPAGALPRARAWLPAARQTYAMVLHELNRFTAALAEVDRLLQLEPPNRATSTSRPTCSAGPGDHERAIDAVRGCAARLTRRMPGSGWPTAMPSRPPAATPAGIEAYRRCIELAPAFRRGVLEPREPQDLPLHAAEIAAMRSQLGHDRSRATRTAFICISRWGKRWRIRESSRRPSRTTPREIACAAS